ncbi:hypothetical protein SK3146_06442 [Paenibacillus konkukensis]|uniref:Uncharacterized protein n=1 Tax=Paenibacillus konkukensis TaxID=2020716 RepID=A0ABY4RZZ0_9BACL|nr:hypothetical protein SK3146_06442 [Paenibacillus konkukensis]
MLHTKIKTFRQRIGKNRYLVIQIFQSAVAKAESGNVLASNAVNVKIYKQAKNK